MIDIEVYNREFYKHPPKETIPLKEEWVAIYDEMKVHTRGETPGTLLSDRRPNEDPAVFEYRKKIYQPITKGPINRSISKLFRIFQNANFSYKVDEQLEKYLREKIFQKRNFFEFFHGSVVKRMIEDPNGYLAWLPAGEGLVKQTEKVLVLPELVDSTKIWFVDDDILTWSNEVKKRGLPDVFYSLTEDGFYEHRERNDKYDLLLIYKHNIGMVPAVILGGQLKEDGVYESYYNPFLPFGNEAIRQYSDWQAVNVTSAFPYRTEAFMECDYPECMGTPGWWREDCGDDCTKTVICPVCKGTKHKPHISPYGSFIRREKEVGEGESSAPMIEFTSPARDILDYSQQSWMTLLEEAKKAVFDVQIEEAQSGVAKIIDREDLHAFLSSIANNVYDHLLLKSLIILNKYRDINSKEDPEITKPTSFVVKTESDLVNELGVLLEKNAPLPFVLETVKDLAKKRFATNERAHKKIDFLLIYDPLFALTPDEKNMLIATNVIDDKIRGKNINSYQVLSRLLIKNPNLMDESYESIEKKMDAEIEKLMVEKPLIME